MQVVQTNQISVCQVVASINENTGGTAVAISCLAEALSQHNVDSHIWTLDYQNRGPQLVTQHAKLHSYSADFVAQHFRGFQPHAQKSLQRLACTELDLVHNHGLWMFPNIYARQASVEGQVPLMISPHGMLEVWSLKYGWLKKGLAWFLYEQQNLKRAVVFHATSVEEAHSIRRLGLTQPIAIIPDAVQSPSLAKSISCELLTRVFPALINKRWLLFLSRVHPKKGLDNLLKVWQKLAAEFPDWHLLIAGPDQIGYQAKLESLTAELSLQKQVTFTGMLTGEMKAAALGNADLFVLPTHSENFGIAIAEALAHAIPVVTTKGAPWQDLSTHECGWWIDNNQEALARALAEGMQLSSQERRVMGLNGRSLVETKYSWNSVAKEMLDVYRWILGGGAPPGCIRFDVPR